MDLFEKGRRIKPSFSKHFKKLFLLFAYHQNQNFIL